MKAVLAARQGRALRAAESASGCGERFGLRRTLRAASAVVARRRGHGGSRGPVPFFHVGLRMGSGTAAQCEVRRQSQNHGTTEAGKTESTAALGKLSADYALHWFQVQLRQANRSNLHAHRDEDSPPSKTAAGPKAKPDGRSNTMRFGAATFAPAKSHEPEDFAELCI
jgi:hypothetical protein